MMVGRIIAVVLAVCVNVLAVPPVEAWVAQVNGTRPGANGASAMVIDASGDVFVAGFLTTRAGVDLAVVKLVGMAEVWRHTVRVTTIDEDYPLQLLIDPAGNLIVGGIAVDRAGDARAILKLASDSGAEQWRTTIDGGVRLAVDTNGDVIVAGTVVVKLSGNDGAWLWQVSPGRTTVTIGPEDDPIVAGNGSVARLAATTGTIRWERAVDSSAAQLLYHPATNVVDVAGRYAVGFRIVRLGGEDGGVVWTHEIPNEVGTEGTSISFGLNTFVAARDGTDDLFAAGYEVANSSRTAPVPNLFAIRISAATGIKVWTKTIYGLGWEDASTIVADSSGNLFIGGWYSQMLESPDVAVFKLSGNSGDVAWIKTLGSEVHFSGGDLFPSLASGARVPIVLDEVQQQPIVAGGVIDGPRGSQLFAARLAVADGATLARFETSGDGLASADRGRAIARDSIGDLVVCGSTQNAEGSPYASGDFTVAKLDGVRGTERWRFVLPDGVAGRIAIGPDGNVVAAGAAASAPNDRDATVVKLAPDGRELWRHQFPDVPPRDGGSVDELAIGSDGAVHVVRRRPDFRADVAKLSPDGVELWRQPYSPFSQAVVVDTAGDLVLTTWWTVEKLAAHDGSTRWWRIVLPGDHGEQLRAAAIDPTTNDVIVVGSIWTEATGLDFAVVRLAASDGRERWRRTVELAGGSDQALAVAIDAAGDIVATGRQLVVKVGPDGAMRWTRSLGTAGTIQNAAVGVAIDPIGNPILVGDESDYPSPSDFFVLALDASSGSDLWRHVVRGSATESSNSGAAIVIDPLGSVSAIGTTQNVGSDDDITVLRLRSCALGCDDADPCTSDDGCDASGFCMWTAVEGPAAIRCAFKRSLEVPACAPRRVPRAIAKTFQGAGTTARRAIEARDDAKRTKLLKRASKRLLRVLALVDRAGHRHRRPLPQECGTALRALIEDARARLDTQRE